MKNFSIHRMPGSCTAMIAAFVSTIATAGIPEPDVVFYGRVLHLGGGEEYLLTAGTLDWTVSPPEGSVQEIFEATTALEPLDSGTLSYTIRIPQHLAVENTVLPVLGGLIVGREPGALPFRNTLITLDGLPLRLADPAGIGFDASSLNRGSYRRLDLVYAGELPDADGDGIPDWWEEKYGTERDQHDAAADPDADGVNNYGEYLAGTDPTGPDQQPKIAAEILVNLPVGGSAAPVLKPTDSDSGAAWLIYTVGTLPAMIDLRRVDQEGAVATFTQAELAAGRIQIRHLGDAPEQVFLPLTLRDETPGHDPVPTNLLLSVAEPAILWEGWGFAAASLPETLPMLQSAAGISGGATLRAPSGADSLEGPLPIVAPADIGRLMIGSASSDTLLGSAHADIFAPSAGDVIRGGGGADRILLAGASETVRIVDFSEADGDLLDFRGLLEPVDGRRLESYFQITGAILAVDANGDGSGFDDLLIELPESDLPLEVADLWDRGQMHTGTIIPETTLFLAVDGAPAEEDLAAATITLRRRGDASAALSVPLTWSGTATLGLDYQSLPTVAQFAAGQKIITFDVVPLADDIREPTESIQIEVSSSEAWSISDGSRTATLALTDLPSRVWLEVAERVAYKNGEVPAQILVRRKGPLSGSLTVRLAAGGRALSGLDYSRLPSTITFEPAQTVATLDVTPLTSATLRYGAEDVILTVQMDAGYLLGETPEARVLIINGPQSARAWMDQHGLAAEDETVMLASDDDGDGLSGLAEFAFGGSPETNDRALLSPQFLRHADGRMGLKIRRWPSAPELRYRLQVSENLKDWVDVPVGAYEESGHEIQPNGIEEVQVYMPLQPEVKANFYRYQAEFLN